MAFVLALLVCTLVALKLALPSSSSAPIGAAGPAHAGATSASPSPTPTPTADPDATFTILAAGDVLPHTNVLDSARTASGYDFRPLLAGIDPWVSGADLALCHFEVPVAPAGIRPSGYPLFGTVPELTRDLKAEGWDGCSTASNHSEDRGTAGITATLDAFDAVGLGHAGTARSAAEDTPQLYRLTRGGRTFTIAHLAVAYGTNGMPVATPWSVDLMDADAVIAKAKAARAAGADFVITSVHCCTEYVTAPTPDQIAFDQKLADSGVVDLVLGHHAHVPQPIALLPGGPHGKGMWVAYGMGNLVSNQDEACCSINTSSGELLTVQVTATGAFAAHGVAAGPPVVTGIWYTPVTVDRRAGHRVRVLTDIPQGTSTLTATQVAQRLARVEQAAGTQVGVRTTPPTPTGDPPVVVPRTG